MARLKNNGLTLIGVLVSIMLLVMAVIIATGVALRSQQAAALSREKLIAANLAREGLELMRYVRDTNQFAIVNNGEELDQGWVQDICAGGATETFTIESQSGPVVAIGDISQARLHLDSDGLYTHAAPAGDSAPSAFSRIITADCSSVLEDQAAYADNESYVEVTAEVSWHHRGRPQTVILKERLYDWYR